MALAAPQAASAGPAEDFGTVFNDWKADQRITACRYTQTQLENTAFVNQLVPELSYTDFPAQVSAELSRVKAGRCSSSAPNGETPRGENGGPGGTQITPAQPPSQTQRNRSPIGRLRIARVARRGRVARELLRITNEGQIAVHLGGSTIRNARGRRARLPGRLLVQPGQAVTVRLGCKRGRRVPTLSGSTAWACLRAREFFSDRGDVAQLVDRAGVVVSQRGFGRYNGTLSF